MSEEKTCGNCRYGGYAADKTGHIKWYCDRYSWKSADGDYLIGVTNPNETCGEWEEQTNE